MAVATKSDGRKELASIKRLMLASLLAGFSIGWLAGLSYTPVVATAIGGLFTLVSTIISSIFSNQDVEIPFRKGTYIGVSLAICIGLLPGTFVGTLYRDWMAWKTSVDRFVQCSNLGSAEDASGLKRKNLEIDCTPFLLGHLPSGNGNQASAPGHAPLGGLATSTDSTFCAELRSLKNPTPSQIRDLLNSSDQAPLIELAKIETDENLIALVKNWICGG